MLFTAAVTDVVARGTAEATVLNWWFYNGAVACVALSRLNHVILRQSVRLAPRFLSVGINDRICIPGVPRAFDAGSCGSQSRVSRGVSNLC